MRTQVAIVGAGPAGMVLARLLHRAGIGRVAGGDGELFERTMQVAELAGLRASRAAQTAPAESCVRLPLEPRSP